MVSSAHIIAAVMCIILVKGLGTCCGALADADYDYSHFEETIIASRMAYQDAGIKAPRHEIDIAEVHDAFTILELMHYGDLGFTSLGPAAGKES